MAPAIKLTYFDIEGVAEAVRLALVLSGTEFEDVRVKFPEWGALKPTTKFGQLPIMTIDNGPQRVQSKAMLRWVGANCSETLYPSDKLLDIEEAIGLVEDLNGAFRPAGFPDKSAHPEGFFDTEEGKKLIQTLREKYVAEALPKYVKFLSDLIKANDGKWLASKGEPTIADCFAVPILRNFTRGHLDYVPTSCLDFDEVIVDYIKRFCAIESVKGRYNNGIF